MEAIYEQAMARASRSTTTVSSTDQLLLVSVTSETLPGSHTRSRRERSLLAKPCPTAACQPAELTWQVLSNMIFIWAAGRCT